MKKLFSWLDVNFEPIAMTVIFYLIMLLVFGQVVLRFGFETGFSWAEELARFAFVWLMYFAFSYATRCQRHIRVSFFAQMLGERFNKILMIFCDFLFLGFALIILRSILELCREVAEFNDRAVTMDITLNFIYGAGALGFIFMCIRLAQSIVWKIRHYNDSMEVFENYAGIFSGAGNIFFAPKTEEKGE